MPWQQKSTWKNAFFMWYKSASALKWFFSEAIGVNGLMLLNQVIGVNSCWVHMYTIICFLLHERDASFCSFIPMTKYFLFSKIFYQIDITGCQVILKQSFRPFSVMVWGEQRIIFLVGQQFSDIYWSLGSTLVLKPYILAAVRLSIVLFFSGLYCSMEGVSS